MELQAALHSLHLYSPDPLAAAHFYSSTYAMEVEPRSDGYRCHGAGRQLQLSAGPANQLKYAQFALHTEGAWATFVKRAAKLKHQLLPGGFIGDVQSVCIEDPDGNMLIFTPPEQPSAGSNGVLPPATLQHFALRTTSLPAMLAFYTEQLGFVLSDAVKGDDGVLRACFLRSDHLHHVLALFFAPEARFDHQSFEAPDWAAMREWGDHMAAIRVPIVWGIGRHGPGNDVFFMVSDPDGNLAEISAEIEHCQPDRPAGTWLHEERTLNIWGKAIMRS
jgi:catechol 2,3-dioxygenase